LLLVAGKPGDDFFGRGRGHQDIVATDRYPLPNERPQCLCQRLRPGGRSSLWTRDARGAATTVFSWVRRAAGGEPEAGQCPACLMRGEVRPIEAGYQGKCLLRGPASPTYHDEVLDDRFWQFTAQSLLDLLRVKIVGMARHSHGGHSRLPMIFPIVS
jgi:hypothetical protein